MRVCASAIETTLLRGNWRQFKAESYRAQVVWNFGDSQSFVGQLLGRLIEQSSSRQEFAADRRWVQQTERRCSRRYREDELGCKTAEQLSSPSVRQASAVHASMQDLIFRI